FNKAFKYPDRFKVAIGIFPPLNTRWVDCKGRYMANFDPCCWGWRTNFDRRLEVIARFYGVFTIRLGQYLGPLYGHGQPDTLAKVSAENPIEMLETYEVRNGQFDLYIGYGGKDQFNIDAQVESFLYVARERGLCIRVNYDPKGKHDAPTALKMIPDV